MTSPAKRKGDAWERACVELLVDDGLITADRWWRQTGSHDDLGDIVGVDGWLVDCKSRADLSHQSSWLDAIDRKALARQRSGALWIKRPRRPAEDGYLIVTAHTWIRELLNRTEQR